MSPTEAARSRLRQQGFACDTASFMIGARWLRFTPMLSTTCILIGTILRSPLVLWTFAGIALVGAAGWHLFDAVFNGIVRFWVQAPALGPNPVPRRFAMALAAAWSAVAGWLLSAGFTAAGMVAGGVLALAGAIVSSTHFCLGSWFYHRVWRRTVEKLAA